MMIQRNVCQLLPVLESYHEEADARIMLHALHASLNYENVVIATPDTDVFLIALANVHEIDAALFFVTGLKDKQRIIDLNAVSLHAKANTN